MRKKARKNISWILVIILSIIFLFSALGKIFGAEQVTDMFTMFGLSDWQLMIGLGLLISTILFLIPTTFSLGVLLLSSFWGGAIATHMIDGSSFATALIFLVLVWVTAYIRNPSMFYNKRTRH